MTNWRAWRSIGELDTTWEMFGERIANVANSGEQLTYIWQTRRIVFLQLGEYILSENLRENRNFVILGEDSEIVAGILNFPKT